MPADRTLGELERLAKVCEDASMYDLDTDCGDPDCAECRSGRDFLRIAEILRAAAGQEPVAWLAEWRRPGGRWNYDGLYRTESEARHLPRNPELEHRVRPLTYMSEPEEKG